MQIVEQIITLEEIESLHQQLGNYLKITADIEKELLVIGCELHADGEKILLERGGRSDNIWGGGINLKIKEIDTTAVLNIRPKLGNNSLEIIDPQRREKFLTLVKKYFAKLWQT